MPVDLVDFDKPVARHAVRAVDVEPPAPRPQPGPEDPALFDPAPFDPQPLDPAPSDPAASQPELQDENADAAMDVPTPPAAVPGGSVDDRFGIGALVEASTGRGAGFGAPLAVLATVLLRGETVSSLVFGSFDGHPGVAATTDQRAIFANAQPWNPRVVPIQFSPDVAVHIDNEFDITVESIDTHAVIASVTDQSQARELAALIRRAVAAAR